MIVESSAEDVEVLFHIVEFATPPSFDPAVGNSIPSDELDGSSSNGARQVEEEFPAIGSFLSAGDGDDDVLDELDHDPLPAASGLPVPSGIDTGRPDPVGGESGGRDEDGGSSLLP